jgi:hypothetical protein
LNTLVPEPEIPSHQGPDAQAVDPDLDVTTMAVKVPETLAHLHYWSVQMTRTASEDEVLDAFRRSSRIALIRIADGLVAINAVKELMADRGRPHDNLYEVALWADMLHVQGDEVFYAYMVDNQAIVIPETIDAIRQRAYRGARQRIRWRGHGASPGTTLARPQGRRDHAREPRQLLRQLLVSNASLGSAPAHRPRLDGRLVLSTGHHEG